VAICASGFHTVGLKSDGTVVAVGETEYGRCYVSYWNDIVAISVSGDHTVGLKADGTVVATKDYGNGVSDWSDIVAICAAYNCTIGVKADGAVVATGNNKYGECNVSDWKLFNSLDALAYERKEAAARAQQERIEAEKRAQQERQQLQAEKSALNAELANLKGFFTGKRRREIEARLAEIEKELKEI
jgi:hypothetical protein